MAVDIDDTYLNDEPITVRVRPSEPGTDIRARAECLTTPEPTKPEPVTMAVDGADDWQDIVLPPRPPGCYRITVSGDDDVEPVSDVVLVGTAMPVGHSDQNRSAGR
jgi:hypothetical protein